MNRGGRLFRWVLRFRWAILGAVGGITAVMAVQASQVTFDSSVEIWFLEDDPALVAYRRFLERFQVDQTGVVGLFSDRDLFTPEGLAAVDRVTRAVAAAPHIRRARSITSVQVARAGEDGVVELAPLSPRPPRTVAAGRQIRRRVMSNALLRGNLVSPDGRAVAVVYDVEPGGSSFAAKLALVAALRDIARRESRSGIRVRHAGAPTLAVAMLEHSMRDITLLVPLTLAAVVLVTLVMFRRLSMAFIPLAVVLVTLVWTVGVMGILGVQVNVVTAALLGLLLAVGVADSVHLLAHFHRLVNRGRSRQEAVEEAATELLAPCLFTSLTTGVGMLSLLVSDLGPLRQFGWLSALGVGIAFLLTVTFTPALLAVLPCRPRPQEGPGRMDRLLVWIGDTSRGRRAWVLALCGLLLLGSAVSLAGVKVGGSPLEYLRQDDEVRQDAEAIDRALGGSISFETLVSTPRGGLKRPDVLRQIEAYQHWLGRLPGVGGSVSVVDYLKQLNGVLRGGPSRLPESPEAAAQLMVLLESDEGLAAMVRSEYSLGRIATRVRLSDGAELARQVPAIEARTRALAGSGVQLEVTGLAKVLSNMEQYLLQSQIQSLILAFAVVTLLLVVLLRSPALVAVAMVPNLAPILGGLGLMVLAGIQLDPGTVMVGSIALGIVVDDTVHFLVRLRRNTALGGCTAETTVHRTMTETGRPIIVTSLVLAAGFLVLGLGSYTPNVHFGLVSATVVLLAVVADLVLLPAMLLTFPRAGGLAGRAAVALQTRPARTLGT